MSKKILIVTEYFYPEEFKINEVAQEWKKKGYIIDILTQNPTYPFGEVFDGYENKWFSKLSYNDMTIYKVKAVTGYKTSLFKKLLKYFSFMILGSIVSLKIGKKYDYVFGFDIAALTGMVPAAILKQFYNKPVTLWIQDVWPDSVYAYGFKKTKILEFCLNRFVKYVYRHTSNFAISAKGFEQKIKPYLNGSKNIMYAPNWADELNYSLEPYKFSNEDKINFTFAGNIGKVQNLDHIIQAFSKIDQKFKDKIQLNIIGDGSHLQTLENYVSNNKINNIIFHGKKPRDEIFSYLGGSDFLIVSLIDKPIFALTVPAKTQTYIASKKPILAIMNGEGSNIISENNLGICVNPSSIEDIQRLFEMAILFDDNQKCQYTKNCEVLTNSIFKREKIIDDLLELLIK